MKKLVSNFSFLRNIKDAYELIPYLFKKKVLISIGLVSFNSLLDIFTIGSVLPFIFLILNPSTIHSQKYIQFIFSFFHFQSELQFIIFAIFLLISLFIAKNIASYSIIKYYSRLCYNIALDLSKKKLKQFYQLPYTEYTQHSSSYFSKNIMHTPIEFCNSVMLPLIHIISESLIIILIIGAFIYYNAIIFCILFAAIGPCVIITYYLKNKKIKILKKDIQEDHILSLKYISEGVRAFIDIKMYQRENRFITNIIDIQKKINARYVSTYVFKWIPFRLLEFGAIVGICSIAMYSIIYGKAYAMIPILGFFSAAAYRLIPSINKIMIELTNIKLYEHTISKLRSIREEENIVKEERECTFTQSIILSHLSYHYPDSKKNTLHNLSLTIKKNQTVGIMGPSGSGKSTLLKIILRFLKEDSGHIAIDEKILDDAQTASWRKMIAYVAQHPFILDDTILENIILGDPNPNLERIQSIITHLGINDIMEHMPNKLQTIIGESGIKLSGGQLQRIAIARALYKNTPLLLLDEATSALDIDAENNIMNTILQFYSPKTIIVISHRPSLNQFCDAVYQLHHRELKTIK